MKNYNKWRKQAEQQARNNAAARYKARRSARKSLLKFMGFVWWKPWPFLIGRHTRAICKRIDKAIADWMRGQSTFLDIAVPFRHGKSDIVSRALPPYFLGRCWDAGLDPDIIMSGYGAELVEGFSGDAKTIIRSKAYHELFPSVEIPRGESSAQSWQLAGRTGRVTAAGLGGALGGKGGHLIDIDDYCKNRAEARSKAFRTATWGAFQDIISRRAPVSMVFLTATPWHVDDIRGRMRKAAESDPHFPVFERIVFPATNPNGTYLFPQRFPVEWYESQYAVQGTFAPALLDCQPQVEGGRRFNVGNIIFHDSLAEFPEGRYCRAWDLASSKKERDSDDPDYTWGTKGTVVKTRATHPGLGEPIPELWIADAVYCRAEAPERDDLIRGTVKADGRAVAQNIEAFGAYKDAYTRFKKILRGFCVVNKANLPGDKSAKLAPVEPVFDAGNIHMLRAPWNKLLLQQIADFPDGDHDDGPDTLAILLDHYMKARAGIADPRFHQQ